MNRPMKRLHTLTILLATGALVLSGCGGSDEEPTSSTTIPASEPFNDADVSFATGMIPHHAQALVMVDMTRGRDLDPEFEALTEQISAAQAPEIETMAGWLSDWDQPIPETMRDHANAESDGSHDMGDMGQMDDEDMPGMMSDQDFDDLEMMSGGGFEEMWLEMMIEHHEGAIEMAEEEIDEGEFPAAVDLAQSIVESQQAEIEQMEQMLDE